MADNADSIGRVLATSTLMNGDRELLQKQPKAAPEAASSSAQQAAATPISHDSKATSAVLLKLLDDRILASETSPEASQRAGLPAFRAIADDAAETSKRVSARYSEEALTTASDPSRPETAILIGQAAKADATPMAAPELQSFIQRFAALATGRLGGRLSSDKGGLNPRGLFETIDGPTVVGIAIVVLILMWLGAMILGWRPG